MANYRELSEETISTILTPLPPQQHYQSSSLPRLGVHVPRP